jgi:hypothetical protein
MHEELIKKIEHECEFRNLSPKTCKQCKRCITGTDINDSRLAAADHFFL